jgi:hypothetical protein
MRRNVVAFLPDSTSDIVSAVPPAARELLKRAELASLVGVFSMRSFQPSAGAVIDESLNLVALLRELERLREQVRKAELARSLRVDRRKRTRIRPLEHRRRLRRR